MNNYMEEDSQQEHTTQSALNDDPLGTYQGEVSSKGEKANLDPLPTEVEFSVEEQVHLKQKTYSKDEIKTKLVESLQVSSSSIQEKDERIDQEDSISNEEHSVEQNVSEEESMDSDSSLPSFNENKQEHISNPYMGEIDSEQSMNMTESSFMESDSEENGLSLGSESLDNMDSDESSSTSLDNMDSDESSSTSDTFLFDESIPSIEKDKLKDDKPLDNLFLDQEVLTGDALGVDLLPENNLETRISSFKKRQTRLIAQYVELSNKRTHFEDHFLYILNGWEKLTDGHSNQSSSFSGGFSDLDNNFMLDQGKSTTGGVYFRWNGKGIVINPGKNFLKYFHEQNLFIKDIDYVIVTRGDRDNYCDVGSIYDLNYQHNTLSKDLHIVQYYLNQSAYEDISTVLKPRFKQERNTVHSLELYIDSPDIEKITLDEFITLRYFQSGFLSSGKKERRINNVAIQFSLKEKSFHEEIDAKKDFTLAYISGVPWSPMLASHLVGTELVIAAVETTSKEDYQRKKYNSDSLGYFGAYSLIEEIHPKLLVFTEFSGMEGDIRLELARKLRQEVSYNTDEESIILPGDIGMFLDLKALRVRCSVSHISVMPNDVKVVKPTENFGNLYYLSPNCFV